MTSKPTMLALVLSGLLLGLAAAPGPKLDPETYFDRGLTHLREGRVDQALEAFKAAVKGDPKNAYFQKGLGQAHLAKREWSKAAEAFRQALEINPYYADVHNDLGTALLLGGKREEARQELLAAYNDPTFATPEVAAHNLGQSYLEEKNYGEAYTWFRTTVQRNKGYADGHLGLADTLAAQQRFDEAVLQLEVAKKELPDALPIAMALADACSKVGRQNEARTYFEELARKDPGGPYGRRALERLRDLPR